MKKRRLGRDDQADSMVLLSAADQGRQDPPQREADQAGERMPFWKD